MNILAIESSCDDTAAAVVRDGRTAYLKKSRGKLKRQLSEFARLYQGNSQKDRLVQQILAAEKFPGRLQILWNRSMYRQSALDEVIMRILFLINRML